MINLFEMEGAFREVEGIPHPDWDVIATWIESNVEAGEQDLAAWYEAGVQWVAKLRDALGTPYDFYESNHCLMLSPEPEADASEFLTGLEKGLADIVATFSPVARLEGPGKLVILCFQDRATYQKYLHGFLSAEAAEGVQPALHVPGAAGSGHIAINMEDAESLEGDLPRELARACLPRGRMPAWCVEAVAMRAQFDKVVPKQGRSSALTGFFGASLARSEEPEALELVRDHWVEKGLGAFWNGEAFQPGHESLAPAVALSEILFSEIVSHDKESTADFLLEAKIEDGGEGAAQDYFGRGLGTFLKPLFGEGDWGPKEPA